MRTHLDAPRHLFVIEELPAWNPNLRSRAAIRTTDVRHHTDPSIAAALGAGPGAPMGDLETFGLLLESLCARDLRTYMEALGGGVSHHRDSSGLECDAVLHRRDGSYALVEVKLGGDRLVSEGASTLPELSRKIDSTRMGSPAFLMVITGVGDFSYPREDSVLAVPVGALGA